MDSKPPILISVVVPVYNEEEVLPQSFDRLLGVMKSLPYDYELVFVDDGSKDSTWNQLCRLCRTEPKARALRFSRNFGHQTAVTAGMDEAKGDAVVIIDADMQDPPEVIPRMVRKWQDGYEVVYGKRLKRKGESAFKVATASLFYRFINALSSQPIPLDTGDFRLLDRKVVSAMGSMREHNRFLRGMAAWAGYNSCPVEYVRDERLAGKTHYTLKKMLRLASDGLIGYSDKPLTAPALLGITVMALSVLGVIPAAICSGPGWLYAFLGLGFLNGCVFVAMGVQGAYIARIHDESVNRPLYLISNRTAALPPRPGRPRPAPTAEAEQIKKRRRRKTHMAQTEPVDVVMPDGEVQSLPQVLDFSSEQGTPPTAAEAPPPPTPQAAAVPGQEAQGGQEGSGQSPYTVDAGETQPPKPELEFPGADDPLKTKWVQDRKARQSNYKPADK